MPPAPRAPLLLTTFSAFLVLASSGRAQTKIFDAVGLSPDDHFGATVHGLGDVNDDGFDDIAATSYVGFGVSGRVTVFFGSATPDTVPDLVIPTAAPATVAGVGDTNDDGIDDFVIGQPSVGAGEIRLYYGGTPPDTVPDLTIVRSGTNDEFGRRIAGADINGDGFSDLIIGAPLAWVSASDPDGGKVYVYYMSATPDGTPDIGYISSGSEGYGSNVRSLGDCNDDGYDDFLVQATDPPIAHLFHGGAVAPTLESSVTYTEATHLEPAGDIDGDGFCEILRRDMSHVEAGDGLLFSSIHWWEMPEENLDGFGVLPVNPTGDLNGDGYDDLVVGEWLADTGGAAGAEVGAMHVYFLGPAAGFFPAADHVIYGESAHWQFGNALAGAGDFNGDGVDDVVAGGWAACSVDSSYGRVQVYTFSDLASDAPTLAGAETSSMRLGRPRPNPIRSGQTAALELELLRATEVGVKLYDVAGRLVAQGPRERQPAGSSTIIWSLPALGAGVYFARAESDGMQSDFVRIVVVN